MPVSQQARKNVKAAAKTALVDGAAHARADALLDAWVTRLERPDARVAATKPLRSGGAAISIDAARGASVREAMARITVEGSVVRFEDPLGGQVVLARVGPRTVHRGTVALRGPLGVDTARLRERGLSAAQARAFEFVAAWFGAPFDAVSATREAPHLEWGFWPFAQSEVARVLSRWKSATPERFDAALGAYGIDVLVARDDLRGPSLTVTDGRGALVQGPRALQAIAGDPKRLAVMARAGRDAEAQAAQLQHAIVRIVQPLLRAPLRRGDARIAVGEVLPSARGLAAVLCAARALPSQAFDEVAAVALADVAADAAEEPLLEALARYLRVAGHASSAHDIRRALSSPELQP